VITRVVVATCMVLAVASVAFAGAVITPALKPPTGGFVRCTVANASATKTVEYIVTIYNFNGTIATGPNSASLDPNHSSSTISTVFILGHCVVELTAGGKKNVRVAFEELDSGGNPLAAVNGQ
jgi:hypothetical protein